MARDHYVRQAERMVMNRFLPALFTLFPLLLAPPAIADDKAPAPVPSFRNEVIPMMTKKMDFSYKDGEDFVFSDPDNYETVTLPPEIVGDAKNYLVENASVTVTFVEDKAVSIEMPSSVVLKVADAPEGVRGDSANNVQKAIVLETGITVQAPLFIKTGEKIKVDTRTGKYMERA